MTILYTKPMIESTKQFFIISLFQRIKCAKLNRKYKKGQKTLHFLSFFIGDFLYKSLIDGIDLLFCVGRGSAEMLFIETVEGGIVVKSAILTCSGSIFPFGDKLLCDDKTL